MSLMQRHSDRSSYLFRLALVTAQRGGELASMHRDQLALHSRFPVWTIPGTTTKNDAEHKVWLSPLAVALIEEVQHLHTSEWMFPRANGAGSLGTPNVVDAWKSARVMLQMPDVRPHDLRRTAATALGELGVADRDIEGDAQSRQRPTQRHMQSLRLCSAKNRSVPLSWHGELCCKTSFHASDQRIALIAQRRELSRRNDTRRAMTRWIKSRATTQQALAEVSVR
jgi:integrase